MTREEVLELIRSHLADELELDPERVQLGTRFREDLAIDSLDLYTMVQELRTPTEFRSPTSRRQARDGQ